MNSDLKRIVIAAALAAAAFNASALAGRLTQQPADNTKTVVTGDNVASGMPCSALNIRPSRIRVFGERRQTI